MLLILMPFLLAISLVVTGCPATVAVAPEPAAATATPAVRADSAINRNVIFFHPDGYGLSHWIALRFLLVGPDGRLNWDKLPYMAPYTGYMKDALTASSHGGATTHAYGVKVVSDSFGLDGHQEITALSGKKMSIMEEAMEAGFATGIVQSGCITEPGTAAFVASVEERDMKEEIAKQVIESGVDVILGGGEKWLLPVGVTGYHGAGMRLDGLNLIERVRELGYTVVYTRDELMKVALDGATRVLGVFAHGHTFNTFIVHEPFYLPWAPTIAEMSTAALEILSRNPKAAQRGIFLVAEEEGTDDFGNKNHAKGSFEAGKRADEALGVFVEFVTNSPETLLITTADSSAGGKCVFVLPRWVWWLATFMSAPDKAGISWPFWVTWESFNDLPDRVVVRAKGLNADRVTQLGVVDNTDIYRIMYYTLFDRWLPPYSTAYTPNAGTRLPTPETALSLCAGISCNVWQAPVTLHHITRPPHPATAEH